MSTTSLTYEAIESIDHDIEQHPYRMGSDVRCGREPQWTQKKEFLVVFSSIVIIIILFITSD